AIGWRGLAVGATAVGLSAAVWLPALTYLPHTVRAEVSYEFVSGGQTLLNYAQLLMPEALTLWTPEYVGLGVLLLASVAWAHRAEMATAEITFWSIAAFLAIWLSLGDKGILFEGWH